MKTAFQIMSWLLWAQRPLKTEELGEALSVEPGDLEIGESIPESAIVECCHGLVVWETSGNIIRFTHETVAGFLRTIDKFLSKENLALFLMPSDIALTCLTYLNFDIFDDFREDPVFAIERMN